jgi:hypothetical protein
VQGVVGLQVLSLADGEGRREAHTEGQGGVVAHCGGGGGSAVPRHHYKVRSPLVAGRGLEAPGQKGLRPGRA